jgi:hypothetical protein
MHLNLSKAHTRLGPDPEPLGDRLEPIMQRELDERAPRHNADESSRCPLELAFGLPGNCAGSSCVFYRVPRVRDECAVREWAPDASQHRELAAWFLARCDFSDLSSPS